jgi:gas vesicle protein
MGKKCIICGIEAKYSIKDSSEFYCNECAEESFSDINYLQKIDEQAKIIKELIKEKANNLNENNEDLNDGINDDNENLNNDLNENIEEKINE